MRGITQLDILTLPFEWIDATDHPMGTGESTHQGGGDTAS